MIASRIVLLSALVAAATATAHAQPSPQSAAAVAQFDQGRDLMKAKKYEAACTAFAQSQALESQLGTLFNLAVCQTHIGKLASAWVAFRELAQRDTNAKRKAESARQAAQLAPRLPHLAITVDAPPPGLAVTLDGADITAVVGTPAPVDLGDHQIAATAPHYAAFATTVTVSEEAKTVAVTVTLVAEPVTIDKDLGPKPPPIQQHFNEPYIPPAAPAESHSHRRLIGGIVAIGGVALVGTGLVFGKQAGDDWDKAKAACGGSTTCATPAMLAMGNHLADQAHSRANLSTGFVIGGGVALVVGAVLFFTAPSSPESAPPKASALRVVPTASPDSAGLVLDGRF